MSKLSSALDGLAQVPRFIIALYFELGLVSFLNWVFVLFVVACFWMERYDKPNKVSKRSKLSQEQVRISNLKRYERSI